MNLKRYFKKAIIQRLEQYGYLKVDRRLLYDWQLNPQPPPSARETPLPLDAPDYLLPSNPRLIELQARYAIFDEAVTTPLDWTGDHVSPDDILYFRGDNAYLWQLRGVHMNVLAYALTTYYVKSIDNLGLMEKLEDDTYFGNCCFNIDNRLVSRDLLDSIIEIYFLEKYLKLSSFKNLTVLDIGAGYGRLAHRIVNAFPNIEQCLCTDAFPVSTFISEYYLRFRNLEERAKVIPLDEIEEFLRNNTVDIALNIHSFPECKLSAIEWWLSVLSKYGVKYLMIVPNSDQLMTNDGLDFSPILENYGYKRIAKDPKYEDPVLRMYGLYPAYYFLFEHRQG